MSLETIARYIIIAGLILALVGGGLYLLAKTGLPLGRLPGDIVIKRGNTTFAFPIVTSIILSIVLTVILNLIGRFLNK